MSESPTDSDVLAVTAQIGRAPRGEWSVAHRCRCGLPSVIETAPRLEDGTPFPTRWWLTCKALSSAIGTLESQGWMREINSRITSDPGFHEALRDATERYVMLRDEVEPLGVAGHPGGGPDHVKCVHAHAAHQLVSGDNPVGQAALDHLAWDEPSTPCVSP